jgi:hypothetical protein
MNFYCYHSDSLIKKIKLKTNNVTLHKEFSHPCNDFLREVFKNSSIVKKDSYFFVPVVIRAKKQASIGEIDACFSHLIKNLEYFQDYRSKHIFFWVGDSFLFSSLSNCENFFMQSCHNKYCCKPLHYISPICKYLANSKNIELTDIDVSFQGNLKTHRCREKFKDINLKFKTKIVFSPPNQPQNYPKYLIDSYIDSIENSKFVLCPRGQGLNSIRFFEAVAAGRIPILISDNVKLPLSDMIDWSSVIIQLSEDFECEDLNFKIKHFIDKNNLLDVSNKLKKIWNNYFLDFKNFFILNLFKIFN